MSLECKVQVSLNNLSEKKAESVRKSLEPDNVNFPENLSFTIEKNGTSLVFNFKSKGDIRSLISSIDEVLEHTQIILRVTS